MARQENEVGKPADVHSSNARRIQTLLMDVYPVVKVKLSSAVELSPTVTFWV